MGFTDVIPGAVDLNAPKRVGNDPGLEGNHCRLPNHFTALKTDGTLWQWGSHAQRLTEPTFPRKRVSEPKQLGTDNELDCDSRFRAQRGRRCDQGRRKRVEVWVYAGEQKPLATRLVQGPERWLSGPREEPRSISFTETPAAGLGRRFIWGWGYDSPLFASDAPLSHELFRMGK